MSEVYLAFDFGMKRIGVAVGQSITKTASPLEKLRAIHGVPDWQDVQQLLDNWKPTALIVGIPFNMDGTEQPMTGRARQFAADLQAKFHLPVHGVDERLTTKAVRQELFEAGGYGKISQANIDSLAATLILEQWMRHL